jgi:hypothetical protein
LGGRGEARSLRLQLRHLADPERHDQQDQSREPDDDDDEHHANRGGPWQPDADQPHDARLDEEGDGGAKDEGAEEIAQEVKDDDRNDQSAESECDLQVAAPALGV